MQQLPSPRGPAYQLRVEDVVTLKADVTVVCIICSHEAPIDMLKLAAQHGRNEFLGNIEDKMKCGKCGLKGMASLKIVWKADAT